MPIEVVVLHLALSHRSKFVLEECGDEVKANVEQLLKSANIGNDSNSEIDDETKDEIEFTVIRFQNDAKRICSRFPNEALHRTLKSLSQDKYSKKCKFDKGKGTTIMDSVFLNCNM